MRPLFIAVLAGAASLLAFGAELRAQELVGSPGCRLRPAAPDAQVVLLGVYTGDALATASVTGPDEETTHAVVEIEPGDRPVHLVLSAYEAVIWTIRGDTRRVAHATLVSATGAPGTPAAGAVGLPASKVEVHGASGCVGWFHELGSEEAVQARQVLRAKLGREADVVAAAYSVGTVSLPSGRTTPAPMALAQVDPAAVVGAAAVAHETLPREFGLEQLVQAGALRRRPAEEGVGPDVFTIVRPLRRFPPGLNGAHAVRFVLPSGLPWPEAGSPGHSCVRAEGGYALRRPCRHRLTSGVSPG